MMKQQKIYTFQVPVLFFLCILHSAIVSLICLQYMLELEYEKSNDNHSMVKF